jgi:hypothetical protein
MNEKRRKFSFLITVLAGGSVLHLFRQLYNHTIDTRYTARIITTAMVCFILEPFRWWEELWWKRRIKKVKLDKPPVFVIGFWRSGTTLLHNLLCLIPGAAYITTYQTVFPNLLLSHSWWFKPIIGLFWPTHRPFDDVKMGMDLPQEEEIALANLQQVSFYNFLYFPKDFERFYDKELFMKDLDETVVARWKKQYIKMIRKASLNTKGDRFISKSPSNMARIEKILEVFPDARFIFIYRDPYKSVESFYRFFHEVLPAVQVQQAHEELSRKRVARIYTDMINRYFVEKQKIPENNLIEIRYEDFKNDIPGNLALIYKKFEIGDFEVSRPEIEKYLESQKEFKQTRYDIEPETIQWVNEYAGDIVEKLNYPKY